MAYGARLESVLSESSQGFESPILRQSDPGVFRDRNVFAASLTNDLILRRLGSNLPQPSAPEPNVDARPEQGGSHGW